MHNLKVIEAEHLSKYYIIDKSPVNYETARDALVSAFTRIVNGRRMSSAHKFWALDDVSFTVNQGEVIGIIGRNGSGKSTLLKIISRITKPSSGRAIVSGRVGALLEVGTGFHQELTGRENIFLNGAILGMTQSEIRRRFDAIVEFSGVSDFLDVPVKRYSSGMFVRLAFAVAAHLDPEILMVDEVLAVGDTAFQKKCLGKMGEISRSGRTVLLVSHNLSMINRLCDRAIWLDKGKLVQFGDTPEVVHSYLEASFGNVANGVWHNAHHRTINDDVKLLSAQIKDKAGSTTNKVRFDEGIILEVMYEVVTYYESWSLIFRIRDSEGNPVFTSWDTDLETNYKSMSVGTHTVWCSVPGRVLRPGIYSVTLGVYFARSATYAIREDVLRFQISDVGFNLNTSRMGIITPILQWSSDRQHLFEFAQ